MNIKCNVCGKEYTDLKDFLLKRSYNVANNIFVCKECIDYYFIHRIIHKYKCPECGKEYDMTGPLRRRRNLSRLDINKCSDCMKKDGYKRQPQTIWKRHGIWPSQKTETKQHVKEKCLQKYGVENVGQVEEFKKKARKKCLRKYGFEYASQAPVVKEKTRNTNMERHGVTCTLHSLTIQEEVKQINKERFGFEYASQSPIVKEKVKNTNKKRLGVEWPMQSPKVKEKTKQKCMSTYGVENPNQIPEVRSKIAKSSKVSKLEKRILEMLKQRDIEYQHQYVIRQNGHTHCFDFAIFQIGKLVALVDTDGLYYHAYTGDADGKQRNDSYDMIRTLCIPEGVRFIVIFEQHLEQGLRELLSALGKDYDSYLQGIFTWCRSKGFPVYQYTEQELQKSYAELCSYQTFTKNSKIGERLIRHFHPSILHARRAGYPSPYEGYMNNELLMKVIKNRFIYANYLEPARILEGFNISKIAPKVSVFSPSLAKRLVKQYLTPFTQVFDPFSGYSGRMLGVCATGKQYIGQDLNSTTVEESNQLLQFLNLSATIEQKDIMDSTGEYECLFTCPPYGDKEIWGTETEFRSADDWVTECLNRFNCHTYLFVVDETTRYKNNIAEVLTNKSHFGSNSELVLLIQK